MHPQDWARRYARKHAIYEVVPKSQTAVRDQDGGVPVLIELVFFFPERNAHESRAKKRGRSISGAEKRIGASNREREKNDEKKKENRERNIAP